MLKFDKNKIVLKLFQNLQSYNKYNIYFYSEYLYY